jgi:hypothetical protein
MSGEIKPICYICKQAIEDNQAWSMHRYDSGHTEYWHFRCYEKNPSSLIPLTKESAQELLNWLNKTFIDERDNWILETKAVLEATLK